MYFINQPENYMNETVKRSQLQPGDTIIERYKDADGTNWTETLTVKEVAPLNRSAFFVSPETGKRYQANYIYFTDDSYMLASSTDTFEVINRSKS